ncbi:helix-turn-helix transcriptional regulator [Streptomyces parvulus]|uniref:XRE family transcriptional regulator n=1 Tax=Streptomyces parvulus TaxID=146923 RepID=A0A369V241_9ACTN|nr:helix-turn-helix transcriptional regulator [Streptomyces parvulus]RDD84609.1 XRE family transcriptional regulator [Streptomyces parvulus]
MSHRSEDVRDFLTTRRARITPEQAGLPVHGRRRVAGLRREEVALLAGVSVDYYVRMERGDLTGASESVLEAVAQALQLDEAEHEHLFDLARKANASPARRRRAPAQRVRPAVQHVLDAITGTPAWITNGRQDILAINEVGRALYEPLFADPRRPANAARFTYLDPTAKTFLREWEKSAADIAASLRQEAGRNPYDSALTELIGELSTRSEDFRQLWAAHNVRLHRTGVKRLNHPVVGDLDLNFETFELAHEPGLMMAVYTAAPDTPAAEKLSLLASWATTPKSEERSESADRPR